MLYLKIITTKTGSIFVYNKSCVDTCVDGKTDTFGPTSISYFCCKTDNCNKGKTNDDSNNGVKMNHNFNTFQIITIVYLILNFCL